ncbi:MAG: diguanylate cyclase [Burkholderiaceae bacterium]|nr:diguanylate cyclase [Burkholderiaceae bacterium]
MIAIEGAAAERTAADTARELVEIYEAQMVRNLGAIDQALKTVKYAYEIDQKPTVLSSLDEKGLLPPKLIFTVSIANRAGEVIASTSSGKKEAIAERQYFLDHLVSDSDIPSIVPVRSTAGDWRIQFSRRLNAADGKFIGVVMVLVEPAYFTSGYERSRLGDFGVLGLVGPDGTFLARRSGDWVTVGESAKDIPASADDDNPKDTVLMAPSWASVEQYLNVRRIYRFPLTVIVGLSKSEQLDSFHRQKISYLRLAILASVLVIVVALVLTRLSWQLAESRKRTRKNQETYYAASEASLDAVFVLRREAMRDGNLADFVIDNVNHQGAVLFGKTKGDFLGKRLCELMPACRENGLLEELENVFQTGKLCEAEWENGHEDVDATWLYRQIVRVEDGVVVIVRDISSRKQEQERISHMAYHDALTGLPNRTLLHDRIQQAMLLARRYEKSMAVVFVDLDDFKAINDNYGHRIGDEVLKIQAKRMVQCLRQTDSVIRLGGDEFVIVMVSQPQNVDVLSPALDRLRDALAEPMHVEGIEMKVTPSIGVARYPNDGEDSETLLRNADTAMYQTKTHGRNNYQYYQHETDA